MILHEVIVSNQVSYFKTITPSSNQSINQISRQSIKRAPAAMTSQPPPPAIVNIGYDQQHGCRK
jgi:hypothetical protein